MLATTTNNSLKLICCKCFVALEESEAYAFGFLIFACEKCIRKQYGAPQWQNLAAELGLPANHHEELELKERRHNAQKYLKYKANRRILEKQSAKRAA